MTYFFDNCISHRLAGMLAALGVDAVALRHRFPETIRDVALFEALSGSDMVFVSCDYSQTTTDDELKALQLCRITAIYFAPFFGKLKFWPQASGLCSGGQESTVSPVEWRREHSPRSSKTAGQCRLRHSGRGDHCKLSGAMATRGEKHYANARSNA